VTTAREWAKGSPEWRKAKAAYIKAWLRKNPDKAKAYNRKQTIKMAEKFKTDPEYKAKRLRQVREWRKRNPEKMHERDRRYHQRTYQKLRSQLLAAYGGVCQCCGESERKFLGLDHINGGGNAEVRRFGSPVRLWWHLKKHGFPPGYQVLCHNCNL
jgi:hypothetical protein